MVDAALYDFAEAALGHNTQMRWSLSESITRRQVSPVFDRCAVGDLTAEEALDACIDTFTTRLSNTARVFSDLFAVLGSRLEKAHAELGTMSKLDEFFMGLNSDIEWSTSEDIARQEMYPLFVKVSLGKLEPKRAVTLFCDSMTAKQNLYLETLQQLTRELAIEWSKTREQAVPTEAEQ